MTCGTWQEAKLDPPYPLLWLRYTGFIVLYPLGVSSELTMAWLAMPLIRAKRIGSVAMPNPANFAFDYYTACWVIIALYLPGAGPNFVMFLYSMNAPERCSHAAHCAGLPMLYSYMLTQRKKILNSPKPKPKEI